MKWREREMERPVSIPVSCSQPGNQTRASPGCSVTCRGWSVCEGSGGGREGGEGRGEVGAAETHMKREHTSVQLACPELSSCCLLTSG